MTFLLNHMGPVGPGGILPTSVCRSRPHPDQGGLRAWGQCSVTSVWARDLWQMPFAIFIYHPCLSKHGLAPWGTFFFLGALNGTLVRGTLGLRQSAVIQADGTDVDFNGICDMVTGIQGLGVGLLYHRHLVIPCQRSFQFGHVSLRGVRHIMDNETQKWISSWWERQLALHPEEQVLTCQLHGHAAISPRQARTSLVQASSPLPTSHWTWSFLPDWNAWIITLWASWHNPNSL